MDVEIKPTEAPKGAAVQAAAVSEETPIKLTGIEGDELDGDIDISELPPLPWTRDNLGEEYFNGLALLMGAGELHNQRNPSLDPRTFGISRAKRLIEKGGYGKPLGDPSAEAERQKIVKQILAEGVEIQKQIDAQLPKPQGLKRKAGAPSLRPTKTTWRERGKMPRA